MKKNSSQHDSAPVGTQTQVVERQIPWTFLLKLLGVIAQGLSILITWPTWQFRNTPVNLPVLDLGTWQRIGLAMPQLDFGWVMLLSLLPILWLPRRGIVVHICVLSVATLLDQYRFQPQFFFIAALILFVERDHLRPVGRWFLISMWIWAGVHKLLSPDWFGVVSYNLLETSQWLPSQWHPWFAGFVGCSEIGLGVLAITRPKYAAPAALALHLGITVFLSPLGINTNYSVIPWNLYTGVIAFWILWQTQLPTFDFRWQKYLKIALILFPVGFYFGWVDPGFAFVLYSGCIPEAKVTYNRPASDQAPNPVRLTGWEDLAVTFPHTWRTFVQHFDHTAPEGSKLHIQEPRLFLTDLYYLKTQAGIKPITRKAFLQAQPNAVAGQPCDNVRSTFAFSQAKCRVQVRNTHGSVFAIQFDPQTFDSSLLPLLQGTMAVEQLQFADCPISDVDLQMLAGLECLVGIGLSNTQITDNGLTHLAALPNLEIIETSNSQITQEGLQQIGFNQYGRRLP